MNQKKNIELKVAGQDITMVSSDSKEFLIVVADHVEKTIANIRLAHPRMLEAEIAVMACFQLSYEMHKMRNERNNLSRLVESPGHMLSGLKRELSKLRAEHLHTKAMYEEAVLDIMQSIEVTQDKIASDEHFNSWVAALSNKIKDRNRDTPDSQINLDDLNLGSKKK